MARKVKCKICKADGDNETFYRVSDENGTNKYYCNKEEYNQFMNEKARKDELIIFVASEILNYEKGKIVPPVLIKKINTLNEFYDCDVIKACFKINKDNIQYAMKVKNFTSEYGMASYIIKIIEGNINDVYDKWKHHQVQKKKQENKKVDLSIMETVPEVKIKPKVESNGILDFIDEEDI